MDTWYDVKEVEGLGEEDGGDGDYGVCFGHVCEIHLCKGMPNERQRWALIHELAHAVFEETGMADELVRCLGKERADAVEENVIRSVVPTLLATLSSVPKLLR